MLSLLSFAAGLAAGYFGKSLIDSLLAKFKSVPTDYVDPPK